MTPEIRRWAVECLEAFQKMPLLWGTKTHKAIVIIELRTRLRVVK